MSLSELPAGAIFGCALLISGVYVPSIIKAQMLFTQSHMLQVFLGGSATSAIVLHLADRTALATKKHPPPVSLGFFPYDGNILGGALIGLGMASTGACPGTALVQFGTGMTNGILVVFGGVLGAFAFARARPLLAKSVLLASHTADGSSANDRPVTAQSKSLDIPGVLSIQPVTMLLLWIPMCLAVIGLARIMDRPIHQSEVAGLVPPAFGGLLIGIAQAATLLLTRHHIGASTAYEDLARWLEFHIFPHRPHTTEPSLHTPSLLFSAGIALSVALLEYFVPQNILIVQAATTPSFHYLARTVAGGACMIFGARLAGGCTSGHGISGLSKFSLASLATTSAMFGGGMLAARALGS